MAYAGIAEVLLYAAGILLIIYRIAKLNRTTAIGFLPFFILAVLLFAYEGAEIIPLLGAVAVSSMMASYYGKKADYLFAFISAAYLIGASALGIAAPYMAQGLLIGVLSSVVMFGSTREKHTHKDIEVRRNTIQIACGTIVIGALLFGGSYAEEAVMLLIILASGVASYAITNRRSRLSMILYRAERRRVQLGYGAIWLALGTLAAMAFLGNRGDIISVFAAIFIADSISTLVGMKFGKAKLPYNYRKSIAGSVSYFVAAASISVVFIGPIGILLGLIAAVVESLPLIIDDNFSVALALDMALVVLKLL